MKKLKPNSIGAQRNNDNALKGTKVADSSINSRMSWTRKDRIIEYANKNNKNASEIMIACVEHCMKHDINFNGVSFTDEGKKSKKL